MPEKLITMDAPTDYTPDIESTGFDTTNIASKQDADALASAVAACIKAEERVSSARSMLNAAAHDLAQHYGIVPGQDGLPGDLMRQMPDDLRLKGMAAEARIGRIFLKEIISVLEEARTELKTVAEGA